MEGDVVMGVGGLSGRNGPLPDQTPYRELEVRSAGDIPETQ